MEEQQNIIIHEDIIPLAPHSYPLCIKIGLLICCILFFISLKDIPYYFKINKKVKKADQAFMLKNYHEAARRYAKLTVLYPDNKYFKICTAKSYFCLNKQQYHLVGLNFLTDITITSKEWDSLVKFIPTKYISYFKHTVKG